MSAESFILSNPNGASAAGPQFLEYSGPQGRLSSVRPDQRQESKMRDGTIDIDVATKRGALFTGIAFRTQSDANLEIVYLRPGHRHLEAMQYTPRLNGDAIWQLLNTSHEKASAHFPKDQWFHIKLVVSGRTCTVFMNNNPDPTMTVNQSSPRRQRRNHRPLGPRRRRLFQRPQLHPVAGQSAARDLRSLRRPA